MPRRSFLAGGCAAASITAPARAASRPIVLRLAFSNSFDSQLGAGASAFARNVNEGCGGRVRVEIYPAGEAGGDLEATQDMRAGMIDMVYAASAGLSEIMPSLGIFDVPFLFRDVAHARTVLDGPIGRQALSQLEPQGVVGLAWGENGLRHITTGQVPVRSPKDLAGLKIRVPKTDTMLNGFKALGAEPVPLPIPALYAALSAGEVQAQENPLSIIKSLRFDRIQKFLCLTGHIYAAAAFLMSRRAYDRLSEQDRTILRRSAEEGAKASRAAGDESQRSDVEELRSRGMTIVADVDRAAFIQALAGAQDSFARQFGKDRLNAIRAVGQ